MDSDIWVPDIVFCDIDPMTYCIDLNKRRYPQCISRGTYKAVVPVDFAGYH